MTHHEQVSHKGVPYWADSFKADTKGLVAVVVESGEGLLLADVGLTAVNGGSVVTLYCPKLICPVLASAAGEGDFGALGESGAVGAVGLDSAPSPGEPPELILMMGPEISTPAALTVIKLPPTC